MVTSSCVPARWLAWVVITTFMTLAPSHPFILEIRPQHVHFGVHIEIVAV